ncbi:hypothetical protein CK203_110404 [Vitis vinifera]|uniref:Uncharacterized protein n=1 Tax=Vitis vinifera TaxID=29760 RepID=A0A438BP94_VITVI|nr:hypothetical protein CK203_110404 [Vitis vinifera]
MRSSMNVGKGIWRPSMLVLIMALIHGSCKNPEEAMDFLSYVSEANNNAPYGNTYNSSWRNIQIFLGTKATSIPTATQTQAPQQTSSVEQAIVNLSKSWVTLWVEQKAINSQLHQKIENVESSQLREWMGCKMIYLRR